MTGIDRAVFRRAGFEDMESATALLRSFGLGRSNAPGHVERWWDWIWRRNPALQLDRPAPSLGWVLEDAGRVVGFFGNIPARYQLGDRTLLVAVASHWAVEKPYRGQTRELSEAYFSQREPDLLMVTTGIAATGRIFTRFGAQWLPVPEYQTVLFWVLDAPRFLEAALKRKQAPPALARAAGVVGGPLLGAGLALRGHGRLMPGASIDVVDPAAVGDEFDSLWQRQLQGRPRLYASRRAADIRWHFELARSEDLRILRARRDGRLDGYLVLMREYVSDAGLVRAKVVDLFVADDDETVAAELLGAATELARELGCHVLEVVGLSASLRALAARSRPLERRFPVHPWLFRAVDEALGETLLDPSVWYPTLFDGDSSLAPL